MHVHWNDLGGISPDQFRMGMRILELVRKTRWLAVVWLVDNSQGIGTDPPAFDKPKLRL